MANTIPDPVEDPSLWRFALSLLALPFILIWHGIVLFGSLLNVLVWGAIWLLIAAAGAFFVGLFFAVAFGWIG